MSADALRIRRARQAIYGPPILAAVGFTLAVVGAIGLAVDRSEDAPTPSAVRTAEIPTVAPTTKGYALVAANGNVYRNSNFSHPVRASRKTGEVVGAARAAGGGLWLVKADGSVIARSAPKYNRIKLRDPNARVAGIAAAGGGRGYRIVTTEGDVYAVGGVALRGAFENKDATPVVGIATSSTDGYWIAQADGEVAAFGAPSLGRAKLPHGTTVVGIASSPDGSGYWLVTNDGHVWAFGVPFEGDVAPDHLRTGVVGITAGPDGGYWLATADGRVYGFGAAATSSERTTKPGTEIVAIVAR